MYCPNGDYFKWQWQYGKENGESVLYCVTGATKKSRFVNGKEEGMSVYDYPFLKIKYVVEYREDKQVSEGVYYGYDGKPIDATTIRLNFNGSTYLGEIKDGKMNGNRLVGKWNHGVTYGKVVKYYSNGTKSLVEYKNNEEIILASPIKIK